MKLRIILILFMIIFGLQMQYAYSTSLNNDEKRIVENFINIIKENNINKLSNLIAYPLNREYPLQKIVNKEGFIKYYDVIFDKNFISLIINSNFNEDWRTVGWRGIMFDNGLLWMDFNGKIYAINYTSKKEQEIKNNLIKKDKENLYKELKDYQKMIGIYKTKKFIIRIDEIDSDNFRYSSWKVGSSLKSKPELVINNCKIRYDGSGGNHSYVCLNNDYIYVVGINIIGTDETPPANLTIYKKLNPNISYDVDGYDYFDEDNYEEILYQPAEIV